MTRILVTGSTTGVGRATAAALLEDGHDVVVHARSEERLAAVEDLIDAGAASVVGDLADDEHVRSIAETRRSIRSARIKAGLRASRADGSTLGRPTLIDDARYNDMVTRREQGESIRSIAQSVGVSVGTVHNVLVRGLQSATHPLE